GFTLNLQDVTQPKLYIADTSTLQLDVTSFNTSPLNFGASITVHPDGLDPFTVGLTVAGGSYNLDAHVNFAMNTNADGSGQYLLSDVIANQPFDLAVSGQGTVDLPMYFPTPDMPMG